MSDINESISRSGVLEGISWRRYETDQNYAEAQKYPEMHIGRARNFEIHLCKNAESHAAHGDYRMELWEMAIVPNYPAATAPNEDACHVTPQYTILIPNQPIFAPTLDDAKCQAVAAVLNYIGNEYTAATQRYEKMVSIFGDLDQILAEKTARRRATDSIDTLGLSGQAALNLDRAGIKLIGELVKKTPAEIHDLPGIGDAALNNILIRLHKAKMRLAGETTQSITMYELQQIQKAERAASAAAEGNNQIPEAPAETVNASDDCNTGDADCNEGGNVGGTCDQQ